MAAFESAQQHASQPAQQSEAEKPVFEDIFSVPPTSTQPEKSVEETPVEDTEYDVVETPKKSSSIFDDPDEDESDVLPIFKGRNIFGNN